MQILSKLILFFLPLFVWGCYQKKNELIITNNQATSQFIPVTQFILGEIHKIDSLPTTPLKIITEDGKSDSQWINKDQFKKEAATFLHPIIDSEHLHSFYSEKSFLDQTIGAFTFSYDPISSLSDTITLKNWNVYVDPQTHTIKRVYLVKQYSLHSDQFTEQLTWKTDESFKINLITRYRNGKSKLKETELIWNFRDMNNEQTK